MEGIIPSHVKIADITNGVPVEVTDQDLRIEGCVSAIFTRGEEFPRRFEVALTYEGGETSRFSMAERVDAAATILQFTCAVDHVDFEQELLRARNQRPWEPDYLPV